MIENKIYGLYFFCEGCQNVFIRNVKQQRYCCLTCRNRINQRKHYFKFKIRKQKRVDYLKWKMKKIKELGCYQEWLIYRRAICRESYYRIKTRKIPEINKKWLAA